MFNESTRKERSPASPTPDTVHHGKMTKADRYQWVSIDRPGEFAWVSKFTLRVDHAYQRPLNVLKARRIAAEFSWPAFGTLTVARRPDGALVVIEGQHRHAGAMSRSEVSDVPCMVFDLDDTKDESGVFIVANKNRSAMAGLDYHTAAEHHGDPTAQLVSALVKASGRTLASKASNNARSVGCVHRMTMIARESPDALRKMFPLIDRVVGDNQITERMLEGLMWVESRMPDGDSLTNKNWSNRLLSVGFDELDRSAKRTAAAFVKGGAPIWGRGILAAINKGLRHKLLLPGVEVL